MKILSEHKYAIIWTICYGCAMWAILLFMFNFDIFNAHQWHRLMRAELHGFAGFVFGILMLAALPLYIATTTLIIRDKKPLITIPAPKIPAILRPTQTPSPVPAPEPESEQPDIPAPPALPSEMPAEMQSAFLRAKQNISMLDIPAPKQPTPSNTTTQPTPVDSGTTDITPDTVPLPADFDMDISDIPEFNDMSYQPTPVFTEINFDTPSPAPTPDAAPRISEYSADISVLTTHLDTVGKTYRTDGDIVITDTYAIAVHNDSDFWVADPNTWFASGKTRPSPIEMAKKSAATCNRTPAIYLGKQNIMDIDKLIPEWRASGITVITDITEI